MPLMGSIDDDLIKVGGLYYLQKDPVQCRMVYRMLQLFCEHHYDPMQNLLRRQPPPAKNNMDLIAISMAHLTQLCKNEERLSIYATEDDLKTMESLFDFVIDAMQGPCRDNQKSVTESGLLETYNTLLKADFSARYEPINQSSAYADTAGSGSIAPSNYTENEVSGLTLQMQGRGGAIGVLRSDLVKNIRAKALKAVMSALESRTEAYVLDEFYAKLELSDLKARLVDIPVDFLRLKDIKRKTVSWEEKHNEEGFDVLFLMTALVAHKPQLRDEAEMPILSEREMVATVIQGREQSKRELDRAYAKVKAALRYQQAYRFYADNVASVEIFLGGGLETLYFPVPSECVNLLAETQDTLLKSVKLGTHHQKIKDFLYRVQDIVFEMQHIEALAQNHLYRFIRDFYSIMRSLDFAIAILINLALLLSFGADSPFSGSAHVNEEMRLLVFVLGVLNAVLAALTASFTIVSRAPLIKHRLVHLRRATLASGHGLSDFTPV